jgi:hypothetical protein
MPSVRIVTLRVTVNNIKILSAAQIWFYAEIIPSPTINKTYIGLNVRCPIMLSDFKQTYESLEIFSQKYPTSNFTENRPVGAEKFGQTDGCEDNWQLSRLRERA